MTGTILTEADEGIASITFSNPTRHNAITMGMWEQTIHSLDALERDEAVRVLVLRGAGEKAFVSGADLSQFPAAEQNDALMAAFNAVAEAAREKLANFPKPVVAMIRGYCLGGGLTIAMLADIRIAAEGSQFGIPAAKLGVAYGASSVRSLLDLVGTARAKEMLFTGKRLDAAQAANIGLINTVVPSADLERATRELAATLRDNAPLSIKAAKFMVGQLSSRHPAENAMAAEVARCAASLDYAEGRRAFAEKRRPKFIGK